MNITEDEFSEKYKPQVNHLDPNASFEFGNGGYMYETYGPELDYVWELAQTTRRVWTIIEGDNDAVAYIAGFHYVNRMGFFVTENPWETGDESTEDLQFGSDWVEEMCPICEEEVELFREFKKQSCPKCNNMIKPCSICPRWTNTDEGFIHSKCDTCPLGLDSADEEAILVRAILKRKKDGTDCTEEESGEIKMFIKHHLMLVSDVEIEEQIQDLFPIEYAEAIDEREGDEETDN